MKAGDEAGNVKAVLLTADVPTAEAVQAAALALDVGLIQVIDAGGARAHWQRTPLRLVGPDLLHLALRQAPMPDTFVVGSVGEELLAASARLHAPALPLPGARDELTEILAGRLADQPRGRLFWVSGASGGLGASSLVAGLAVRATAPAARAAAVELTPFGGGLDLLFAGERRPGLRWKDLVRADGRLGRLDEQLLVVDGVSVLALDREDPAYPPETASATVLESLVRSHSAVFVDAGRAGTSPAPADAQELLIVGAEVGSVSAARMWLAQAAHSHVRVVVRAGPGRNLPPTAVAEALGAELLGVVRHDPSVPRRAQAGMPVVGGRGRLGRDVGRIWEVLSG